MIFDAMVMSIAQHCVRLRRRRPHPTPRIYRVTERGIHSMPPRIVGNLSSLNLLLPLAFHPPDPISWQHCL